MPIAHSADGAQLYYESHGRGPALLLLAGQCCDHREWTRVAQDFATQFQVIVWDYRGTGQSDKPAPPPTAHAVLPPMPSPCWTI